ncbi:MAG: GrdX family protein [Fusobacteria bacterium]|nr:GrdX family protein [Fusobacteriota bacterium]
MRKEIFVVSNNRMVAEKYQVVFVDGNLDSVFEKIRDLVHQGNIILTHPLAGSIKPHETEYKSVVMEKKEGSVDVDSLRLIENAIETSKKFVKPVRNWGKEQERIDNDLMFIDFSLVQTGVEGLGTTLYKIVSI